MELEEKVVQIAQLVEEAENDTLKDLFIPILDGFNKTPDTDDKHMVAVRGNTIEQFYNDGALKEGESLDEKIIKVQNETVESLPSKELYHDDAFKFFEKYDTDIFEFYVYAQDILIGTKEDLSFIRQMNAYFISPVTNEFCQVSLAAGRYKVSDEHKLVKDIEKLEEDEITKGLIDGLRLIMDNIRYNQ